LPGIPGTPTGPDTVDLYTVITSLYNTTGGTSASSYTWELTPSGAGTISGAGTTGTVTWNPNFLGTALIGVKSVNSCGESAGSDQKQTIVINTINGISEIPSQFAVMIYPNPASDLLTVELPGYKEKLATSVEFYEIRGEFLNKVSIKGSKTQIDISKLPVGVYMIKLTAGNEFRIIKFVKI
jgi:hypothetical protein